MKRLLLCIVCVCTLGSAFLTSGCGPGLIAAGGGGVGAIFGLQGGDDDDDKAPPPAPSTAVAPAVIVTSLTREESPSTIQYTIIDANADTCSIEVEYSTGGAFLPCFAGTGGDGVTGLSSSASGVAHVFEWDFAADLGPSVTQGLSLRIRANDGGLTGSWSLLAGQTIGNEAPVPSAITPIGTDVILISFDLADANGDLGSIEALYSIDQGQNFIPIDLTPGSLELIGNPPVNLLTSPIGAPSQFIWNSAQSLSDYVGDVLIQLVPKDQPAGYSEPTFGPGVVSTPFPVDNSVNSAPELAILGTFDGLQFAGQVPVDITLRDTESDAAIVVVQYSIDGGQNFADATLINQFAHGVAGPFLTSPSTTQFQIVWDALTDLGQISPYVNSYSDVMLLLIPLDSTVGTPRVTGVFGLDGNTAPQVQSIGVYQVTGNIPVVINVADDNSHPVSLDIQYSTDGIAFTTLNAADFAYGDPDNCLSSPTGTDNVLVWNTFASIGAANHAGVILRVTPTDHPLPLVPAADETGPDFDSAPFPVINDASSNQPVSLDLFTTTVGGTADTYFTVEASGQAYLDRIINPPNAAGFGTYWRVIGGSSYGTLQQPGGGALDYAVGEVEVAAPGAISDGDTFVIDDGINGVRTFEFDTDTIVQFGRFPVYIGLAATQNDVAVALADAVNGVTNLLLTATVNGAQVTFTHDVAARIGNAISADPALGNATDMAFSGTAGTVLSQLNGGDSVNRVQFDAPATLPGGSLGVQIECSIDDPLYAKTVTDIIFLYWGDEPLSVDVQPLPATILINATQQFTADVLPAGAPQIVSWQIMAGTGHGIITNTGLYTAPNKVPNTNPVPIRASSVDSSVFFDFVITIQPLPSQVTVIPPSDNPPTWIAPDLRLGASIQFSEAVIPAAAPQQVVWRIHWNNQEWGSGNSTVGQITAGGVYTAPATLPSPTTVRIDAVSQVAPSIFGSYTVTLVAPPPTSFEVTPLTATVFAGGQGVQFNAVNFLPTNANTAVSWELSPVVGSIVNGFYTPPAGSLTVQVITVTARSIVATTVTAQATVTVNPNVQIAPTGVDVTPVSGATISAAQATQPIQFSATVTPRHASHKCALL